MNHSEAIPRSSRQTDVVEIVDVDVSSADDNSSEEDSDYQVGGKLGFQSNIDDFLNVYTTFKENPQRLGFSQAGSNIDHRSFQRR